VRNPCLLLLVCMVSMLALAQVTLDPSSPSNLGDQPIGYAAGTPFTLANGGPGQITIESITVSPSGPYFVFSNPPYNCPTTLSQQGACTIWVEFNASAPGWTSGTLTVTYETTNNQQEMVTASLMANGIYDVSLVPLTTPPHHISCNVWPGEDSGTCTVTLVNQQAVVLTISGVSVSPSQDFSILWNMSTCTMPGTVPPFGSCTMVVEYTGSDYGVLGTLQVTTNSRDGSPPILNMQGNCRHYGSC
jgi:hypothetical protein